jgi:hypothetical protein
MKNVLSCSFISHHKTKELILSIGIYTLLWLVPITTLKASTDQLTDVPTSLPEAQRAAFTQRHDDLVKLNLKIKDKVKAHNAKCKNIPEDSPLVSECEAEKAALQIEIADYHQLVQDFNDDLASSGSASSSPVVDSPEDLSNHYDPAKIQAEVKGIVAALKQLQSDNNMDNAQRAEVEKKSAAATRDAYVLGAHATVDALSAYTQRQIVTQSAELNREEDMLINETEPNRREQLHAAFKALKERKDELKETKERIEKAQDAVDLVDKSQGLAFGTEEEESKGLLESVWNTCDKLKVLPPGSNQAKTMVDAYYDVAVQAYSVGQINILNTSADQRLKAINILSKKLESLIDLQKVHRQNQSNSQPDPSPPNNSKPGN